MEAAFIITAYNLAVENWFIAGVTAIVAWTVAYFWWTGEEGGLSQDEMEVRLSTAPRFAQRTSLHQSKSLTQLELDKLQRSPEYKSWYSKNSERLADYSRQVTLRDFQWRTMLLALIVASWTQTDFLSKDVSLAAAVMASSAASFSLAVTFVAGTFVGLCYGQVRGAAICVLCLVGLFALFYHSHCGTGFLVHAGVLAYNVKTAADNEEHEQ